MKGVETRMAADGREWPRMVGMSFVRVSGRMDVHENCHCLIRVHSRSFAAIRDLPLQ
jgi:hypothetical protein